MAKHLSVLLRIFTLAIASALTLDTVIYPYFTKNYFYFDAPILLIIYMITALIFIPKVRFLPENIIKLNRTRIFPILIIILSGLVTLELNNHPNYVYSLISIDIIFLSYLTLLSGFITYIFWGDHARKKPLYYVIPPLSLILMYCFVMYDPRILVFTVQEDGIAEYGQAILYVLAGFIAFKISRRFWKKSGKILAFLFILFAIGSIFVGFEEISWGQRIFGIETPEFFKELNHQDEITIHNMDIFQKTYLHISYMIVGLYGAFSRSILKNLFPKINKKYLLLTPPGHLFFCFFSVFASYFIIDYILVPNEISVGNVPLGRWEEVFETYSALGFFGYAKWAWEKVKKA